MPWTFSMTMILPRNGVLDLEQFSNFCGACVGAAENENISAAQTELLKWHWK
jgi:hypothetical protein